MRKFDSIQTAAELVAEVQAHGMSTAQEDICRAQDIFGRTAVEELVRLANDIGRNNDQGQPDPQGSWSSGRRSTQGTFYTIAFSIWNWEDATRFWNLHTNPERQTWKEVERIIGVLRHKVMVAEIDRDAAKSLLRASEKKASGLNDALTGAERRACTAEAQVPAAGVYDTSTKGKRARTVDVGPHVLELLQQLREVQASSAISKWVFTKEGSPEPMHPQTPTEYFHSFGQRYGIEDFHPHKLRHTSASVALTNGADLISVSERLGHKDPATTARIYAHANQESIRRAGQIVRDAIEKAGQG